MATGASFLVKDDRRKNERRRMRRTRSYPEKERGEAAGSSPYGLLLPGVVFFRVRMLPACFFTRRRFRTLVFHRGFTDLALLCARSSASREMLSSTIVNTFSSGTHCRLGRCFRSASQMIVPLVTEITSFHGWGGMRPLGGQAYASRFLVPPACQHQRSVSVQITSRAGCAVLASSAVCAFR